MVKQRWIVLVAFALVSALGVGTAHAANILASEGAGDVGTLVGSQFDVTAFVVTASGPETADGGGSFLANQTASGQALVLLLESAGGPVSDWLQVLYSSTAGGGFGSQAIVVHWRSDADPGGVPALPTLPGGGALLSTSIVETGGVQDVTNLLAQSAALNGFLFPSNITIQVQSARDVVPEPATLMLTGLGLAGMGTRYRRRRQRSAIS